ncbi:hypothetical protein V8V73_18950 [Priestia megaterium]|uniref:STM4504/CBY_0614 family protein n=1 Tax=Priestia megaterium TaxID=1404 RepID=UPI003008F5D2
MTFFEPFSIRNATDQETDVYTYDKIPYKLRVQIIHMLNRTFEGNPHQYRIWKDIGERIKLEFGISIFSGHDHQEFIKQLLLEAKDKDAIDVIDIISFYMNQMLNKLKASNNEYPSLLPNIRTFISELNFRFKQHQVGYEIVNGQLIRMDNQLVHNEIVKPAIKLLFEEEFESASSEFLQAHEHYRRGEYEEAITDAGRAFESTMKIICDRKEYSYPSNASANKLINILSENEFLPPYLQNSFSHLWNTLSSGLPSIRNRNGTHGQGTEQVQPTDVLANFAINLAASNINFLVKTYKNNQS